MPEDPLLRAARLARRMPGYYWVRRRAVPRIRRSGAARALAIGEDGVRIRVQVQLLGQPLDALVTGKLGARDGAVTFRPDAVRLGERWIAYW